MEVPARFLPTATIAPETFLIRQVLGEGMGPIVAPINTMVIRGEEPVIVDTGMAVTRDGWLEHAFEIVAPEDVRWVYLSHDDADHVGAVTEVLEQCPNATLVTDMFSTLRMSADVLLPLDRVLILNPGESFVAGDRRLTAIIPPVFDSPTTRGLYDSSTRVYWAADAFAVEAPMVVEDIDELAPGDFREAFLHTQRLLAPWHSWLDADRYNAHLASIRELYPTVAVGAHGPAFVGSQVTSAFNLFEELPYLPPVARATQSELELLLASIAENQAA